MAFAATFCVEGAGTAGVDGVYVREDLDWKAEAGRGSDHRPKFCAGSDVFRKPGTSFALLRKGNSGWSLADLRGSATATWSLRVVELYFAARVPAGATPPPLGWSAVDGTLPAPLIQAAKTAPILSPLKPIGASVESILARTGRSALGRATSEPRMPRVSQGALTLSVLRKAGGTLPLALSRADDSSFVCIFRVTLVRPNARMRWGFAWAPELHKKTGTRMLESIEPESPLSRWNLWQEVRKRRDLCVTPGDRLIRVDGLWATHDGEVGQQDGDRAKDAVKSSEAGRGDVLVLEFARPVMRPPRTPPPVLQSWELAPPTLIVNWRDAEEGLVGVRGWALCIQDVDERLWYVVDGATSIAQPLARNYAGVGAFRPDHTTVGVSEGLPPGRTYVACVAALTEKGWSPFSEASRSAKMRLDAGALVIDQAPSPAEHWPGRPSFAVPRELAPGSTAPLALHPGPRELLRTGRRLRLRALLPQRAAEALRSCVRPTGGGSALLVEKDLENSDKEGKSLLLHGAALSLLPQAGDVIVRINGASGAPQMYAEIQRKPEDLALTIERWAGGTSDEEMAQSSPETAFVLDARLDGSMVKAAEEFAYYMLAPEEGVLASRMTEGNPDKLEDALRRVAAAMEMEPPLKCVFPKIIQDAERKLILSQRIAANAGDGSVAEEKSLGLLKRAMCSATGSEEELKAALKAVSEAPQAIAASHAARALVSRAEGLRKLWQWRRHCLKIHKQLVQTLEDVLQKEADRYGGQSAPANDEAGVLHELGALTKLATLAKDFSSEMEFDLLEALQVLKRLQKANERFRAQKVLELAACDSKQDKAALVEAIEAASKAGVHEHVIKTGKQRLDSWRSEHEKAAHHDELFKALQGLELQLNSRDKPGAGVEEQRRLRRALAGSGLPPEAPMAVQAAFMLKRWEASNGLLRAEARLRSAVERAIRGFSVDAPDAGDLLGSAIAEVSQRGVEGDFLKEAKDVLRRWQDSRLRHVKQSLRLAVQYRDEEHLIEVLKLARQAGLDESLLHEAERCLQRLRWEEEVHKLLDVAMEADDAEQLEAAVQRAHDRSFLEKDNPRLQSAALQFHLRFWRLEMTHSLATEDAEKLGKQLSIVDARLSESEDVVAALKKIDAPEVAVRTLKRDMRSLELQLPRARKLASVRKAELALRRVLGAVERHAEELPEVIAAGKEQAPHGLDRALLVEAEKHLKAYSSTVEALSGLIASASATGESLKDALIRARLAGAPEELVKSAFEALEAKWPDTAARARTELEVLVALQEADDIDVLPAEARFLRLNNAADSAGKLQPPLSPDVLEQVGRVSLALAAERTFVLAVVSAEELLAGSAAASPQEVALCLESLQRACTGARQDAQEGVQKSLPAALQLCARLQEEKERRQALLDKVRQEVESKLSTMYTMRAALIAAREGFLPGELLREAYSKLRKLKLEGITLTLHAAQEAQMDAIARALWQRGRGLNARDERMGDDWRQGRFRKELEVPTANGVMLEGSFTAESCGGSFGTRTWRKNPCFLVRPRHPVRSSATSPPLSDRTPDENYAPRVTVAIAEVGGEPANLSVHVVQNSMEAHDAGCGALLVPGYTVLASSQEGEEVPNCMFDLPFAEDPRPVLIVPSSARGEQGPFLLTVEAEVPIDVLEVPLSLRSAWRCRKTLTLEWNSVHGRPAVDMGGGRTMAFSPPLSWYRNPQLRITASLGDPLADGSLQGSLEEPSTYSVAQTAYSAYTDTLAEDTASSFLTAASTDHRGALLLAVLTPQGQGPHKPVALHLLRNQGPAARSLHENPQLHEVVAHSGHAEEEYSAASEVGAVHRLPMDKEGLLMVPSLSERSWEGTYTLHVLSTEEITVDCIT